MIADDFAPPIADEFRRCYEEQNLGISYDAALRNVARRTGIMELRILVIALLVQSRSGGSLVELMQNLATMVRKRLVLQQKVRALTGEGRMQALVLIALPILVFVAMYVLNREYAQVLLEHPWLLAGCAAAQAAGAAVIHKLIQIEPRPGSAQRGKARWSCNSITRRSCLRSSSCSWRVRYWSSLR
jgi:tight adherence protein B